MAPSSSGLGRRAFIPKIAGSIPAGVTKTMSERLPVIYSAHHAGSDFGAFDDRTSLTKEQKTRFSDYGTSETVPTNGILTLRSKYSRALVDLNRSLDDPDLFPKNDFALPQANTIWEKRALGVHERKELIETIWHPYHDEIKRGIDSLDGSGFVVSWDNTAHKYIGFDKNGQEVEMKSFILSNRGGEGSPYPDPETGEPVTCEPEFLEEFAKKFKNQLAQRGIHTEIYFNLVFRGGYVTQNYNTFRKPDIAKNKLQSFQVEYDTILTHEQDTLWPYRETMLDIRESFEKAMEAML